MKRCNFLLPDCFNQNTIQPGMTDTAHAVNQICSLSVMIFQSFQGYLSTVSIQIHDLSTDQSCGAYLCGTCNIGFRSPSMRCNVMTNAAAVYVVVSLSHSRHLHEVGQVRLIFTGTFAVCSYHVDRSPLFTFASFLIAE